MDWCNSLVAEPSVTGLETISTRAYVVERAINSENIAISDLQIITATGRSKFKRIIGLSCSMRTFLDRLKVCQI